MITWTLAASVLSASNPVYQGWRDACQQLELLSSNLSDRVAALDAFLDQVDGVLIDWEQEFGLITLGKDRVGDSLICHSGAGTIRKNPFLLRQIKIESRIDWLKIASKVDSRIAVERVATPD